jgi:photosystem II stability/assembly factor-like uncharacterized protein
VKKFLTLAAGVLLLAAFSPAQSFQKQPPLQDRPYNKPATFWDVQEAFQKYWEGKTPSDTEAENAEEEGYQQFKRWEAFMLQRTYPSGVFPSPEALYQQYKSYPWQNSGVGRATAGWSFIGPHVVPGNGGGAGRINCIEFDPNNSNIIWIGAACGGLWKSTDGGASWSSNTDQLPSLSISDIVIDPTNPQTMYIATGDKYGIYYQYEVWGHYSAGVMKSTDGGQTWNQTSLSYSLANVTIIQRLIMDPSNTNTLYAATNMGIFKTTDGGTTWNNIRTGKFYDIEMKPGTSSTLYTGDSTGVFKSTNSGATWSQVPTVTSTGRTSIAVTPANPAVVYVWSEGGAFYYSGNSGTSFTARTDPSGNCTPYGYYDMVLEVSPANENILFTGGLDIARTTDGGNNWTTVSDWAGWPASNYVHADNHAQKFAPGSSTVIYSCNDGGIFRSSDQGTNWSDLSGGIDIKQYYRIGPSYLTPGLIYAGAQDNGTDRITGLNSATQVNGADGEDCLVDFTDDNIVFVSSQGGYFLKSTDGGTTFNALTQFGCDWTSPIIMDPTDNNVMYLGASDVYKSTDNGNNWTNMSNGFFDGSCVYSLEVCANQTNNIYAATFGNIYRSTNGGTSWTLVTGALPVNSAAISGIAVSDSDPNAVWVTMSGFSSGNKVFASNDGGATWANVSGTLPNVPVNCIEYQNNSNDLLYIGTDLGVFYTDGTLNDWYSYNTGLPNVIIDELEIHYPTSKLRAATFGRGIWESDLEVSTLVNVDAGAIAMVAPPTSTCDSVITPVVRIRNSGVNTLTSVDLFYRIDNLPWQQYSWSGSLASFATANLTLITYTLTPGSHSLKAYTTNPNTSADMNNNNDTILRSFTILSPTAMAMIPVPVQEGFVSASFPPTNFTLENSSNLWSHNTSVGGYGNSTNSAMADFYSISSGIDVLATNYVDFTNAIPPIRMYFDLAYAPFTGYVDSLVIDMYSECPGIATRLYWKGSAQLATAPAVQAPFTPTPSQWRTDTLNLDSLAGHAPMTIRFLAKSGYGNNLYIDNINIHANAVGIASQSLQNATSLVYPNPAASEITVVSPGECRIVLYDLLGHAVKEALQPSGSTQTVFDVADLPAGIYLVRIERNGVSETQRVAIAH